MPGSLVQQLKNPSTIQTLNKRLPVIVNLLLILTITWLLTEITWQFFPQDNVQQTQRPVSKTVNHNDQQNFRNLTGFHIFGTSRNTPLPQTSKAPITKLNLVLKGVLAAIPMSASTAIIAQGRNAKEKVYGIGDKIRNGVTIREIYSDYVVLDSRGHLEILKLQRQAGLKNTGNTSYRRNSSAASYSSLPQTPAQALSQIRRNILRSPTSFGNYALPIVVRQNGKQVGYRLQPQAKGYLLSEIGIQPSDIITQINGVKLNTPQNGIRALRTLSTASQLTLMVKRNGTEVPLSIQLK